MKTSQLLKVLPVIVFLFVIQNNIVAQNTGPASPEYSSFEPVDAADMVDLLSGDFVYTLPLIGVPGPEGGYPLALSYHGGITMDQEASWVGLGWTLNAGAINRAICDVPDDANNLRKTLIAYDPVKENVYHEVSISYGFGTEIGSIGLSIGWNTNKSFGGGVSLGASLSGGGAYISASQNGSSMGIDPLKIMANASPGSEALKGASEVYQTDIGISLGDNGVGLSSSVSVFLGPSIGINYNTANQNFSSSFTGTCLASQSVLNKPSFTSSSFSIYLPLMIFDLPNIGYSRTKMKTWLYEPHPTNNYGIINYSKAYILNGWHQDEETSYDSYIIPYSESNFKDGNKVEESNCLSFPAYDAYSISAQGLSGTMSPQIHEWGTIARKSFSDEKDEDGEDKYTMIYFNQRPFDGNKRVNYYLNNELVSYLNMDQILFDWDKSTCTFPEYSVPNKPSLDVINDDNSSYYSNNRKGSMSYVEYFTNQEIIDGYTTNSQYNLTSNVIKKGFIECDDILGKRNEKFSDGIDSKFDPNGIGAFSITSPDGKTYHYSLPVYQYEEFSSVEKIGTGDRSKRSFVENRNLSKYAYNWLLTSITGPDYLDRGTIGVIDDQDYGYWVKFEYGKWSDAYIWRTPYTGYANIKDGWGSYTWGRKQIYYLDAIKTRTHTALFIKETRQDAFGAMASSVYGNYNYTIFPRPEEGCNLFGLFPCSLIYNICKSSMDLIIEGQVTKQRIENHVMDIPNQHKSLKLNKIILINNSNLSNISKNTASTSQVLSGSIHLFEEKWFGEISDYKDFNKSESHFNVYNSGVFYGQMTENVYDIDDLVNSNLQSSDIIKTISFNYDYSLCLNTPNALAGSGKLSLNSVSFTGKGDYSYMPPYSFSYLNNKPYNKQKEDNWGFYVNENNAWSLGSISMPTGGKLFIEYENDDYGFETALNTLRYSVSEEENSIAGQTPNFVQIGFTIPAGVDISKIIKNNYLYFVNCTLSYNRWHWFLQPTPAPKTKTLKNVNATLISVDNSTRKIIVSVPFEYTDEDNYTCAVGYAFQNELMVKGIDEIMQGGGTRVSKLRINDGLGNNYFTNYFYDINGKSSGVTSYAPFKNDPFYIPYVTEIPGPSVMYKSVTINNENSLGQSTSSTQYLFNVLPAATNPNNEFTLGDLFYVEEKQDELNKGTSLGNGAFFIDNNEAELNGNPGRRHNLLYARSTIIHDNLSALGRIEEVNSFNNSGDLLNKTVYTYYNKNDIQIGVIKESFADTKGYWKFNEKKDYLEANYFFTTSSRVTYPNILKSVTNESSLGKNTTSYGNADLPNHGFNIINGACQYTESEIEKQHYVNKTIFAFEIPAYAGSASTIGMGSKLFNPENANMLSQIAGSINYKNDKVINASIETWKGTWANYMNWDGSPTFIEFVFTGIDSKNIWRKEKTFAWKGALDKDGSYLSFPTVDILKANWSSYFGGNGNNDWLKTSQVTRYDHYSTPLEVSDINGDYAATKKDANNEYVISTAANASYTSYTATGFENQKILGSSSGDYLHFGGEALSLSTTAIRIKKGDVYGIEPHTGDYCLSVPTGITGAYYKAKSTNNLLVGQKYRASVWVHKNSPGTANLSVRLNDAVLPIAMVSAGTYGNWIQYNLDFDVLATTTKMEVSVIAQGGTCYIDDFRVSPYEAAVTSYTYDNAGNVTAILNTDNFAIKYEYDDAGRLINTYVEKPKGFERTTSYRYGNAEEFDVTPKSPQYFTWNAAYNLRFEVTCTNTNWTITKPSWITITEKGTDYFIIEAETQGYCGQYRSGTITVQSAGIAAVNIPVSQAGTGTYNVKSPGDKIRYKIGDQLPIFFDACVDGNVTVSIYNSSGLFIGTLIPYKDYNTGSIGENRSVSWVITPKLWDASGKEQTVTYYSGQDDKTYKIQIRKTNDPTIVGYSGPFYIDQP